MMASEIFEFDAAWAEKWTKTGVPFLSAPTVTIMLSHLCSYALSCEYRRASVYPYDLTSVVAHCAMVAPSVAAGGGTRPDP